MRQALRIGQLQERVGSSSVIQPFTNVVEKLVDGLLWNLVEHERRLAIRERHLHQERGDAVLADRAAELLFVEIQGLEKHPLQVCRRLGTCGESFGALGY